MFFVMKYTCRELLYFISLTLNIGVETRDVEYNTTLFYENRSTSHIHIVQSFVY